MESGNILNIERESKKRRNSSTLSDLWGNNNHEDDDQIIRVNSDEPVYGQNTAA